MGRVKLPLKKIENYNYRYITYSKRKNGLVKKAFELSTLCDIDLALIIFSPSEKLVSFGGNKRVEQILKKYIDLPLQQRGRLPDQERLRRLIDQMCQQVDASRDANSIILDFELEKIQNKISSFNFELEDVEKQLGYFEKSTTDSKSINEIEYHERILADAMKRLSLQIHVLKEKSCREHQLPSHTLLPHTASVKNVRTQSSNYGSGFPQWLDPSQLLPATFANPAVFQALENESEPVVEFLPTSMDFVGASYQVESTAIGASDTFAPSIGNDSSKYDYKVICPSKFDRNFNAEFTRMMNNIPKGTTTSMTAGPSQSVAVAAVTKEEDDNSSSPNNFLNIPFLF